MQDSELTALTRYAKSLAHLTPEQESFLLAHGPELKGHLPQITEYFYENLLAVPEAAAFLGERVDQLKKTHLAWLETVVTGPYDNAYTAYMYQVGKTHVLVNLPVEFMAGGMTLIMEAFHASLQTLYRNDPETLQAMVRALTSVLGFSLILMQKSYQLSANAEQLTRFLKITGISRELYTNMSKLYKE
ncbi:protoglobin domain-containing protein [Candidatus Methylocalor cossyra]|uniref:Protoglobin n=1 Tax=Candidatus Methylocalor cossyra TaxID=3108543 RepID=A0ABM9NHB3_9GAMM